ncbi:MAG: transglutaminaseTgpA domain-containing protein [Myxococcota bacterium]
MSQRDFRVPVHDPRPASAWAMVTLAGATLWITQQLDFWAIAAQATALLVSLWRRTDPFPWQRSPIALNVGMFAIVIGTVLVALRGHPSTIALAHFAATTQGLQLLDARPRRTEFLLVALALFQVILAANLTDSVFFTPLLVGFLFATVWTLMVHTLRSEAIAARVDRELPRALTPGLVRTTSLACVAALLIAALLFVTLPRLRSSVVTGSGAGLQVATSGFSDTVEFGELGRIRKDPRVVLRVETLEGSPPAPLEGYWRGLAFDRFDGTSWSVTPPDRMRVPGSAEGGIGLTHEPARFDLVQRIVREPVAAGVIFAAGLPRGVQGTVRRLERDESGGLYAAGQADERIRYPVRTDRPRIDPDRLVRDRALPPRRMGERYLQLPALDPAFHALAHRIVDGAEHDAGRVRAIESHLLRNGRYSDSPPSPDPESPLSPVEGFVLGDLAGHCEYFASAMVLLARANGLPARLVNGFAGGRENSIGGFLELSRSDAHAWVEVHYERHGWVRYDPTPADLRMGALPPESLATRLRELGSALELWWFQRVVGFDRADQIKALKSAWLAWRDRSEPGERTEPGPAERKRAGLEGPWREGVLALLCSLAALAVAVAWIRRSRGTSPLPAPYRRALRLLARRGLVREPHVTAREFAERVRSRVSPAAASLFDRLTEDYLAERFGAREIVADGESVRLLRRALRAREA